MNLENRITNISATIKDTPAQSQSERIRGPRKVGRFTIQVKKRIYKSLVDKNITFWGKEEL